MKPPKSKMAELAPNATGGEKSHAETAESAEFKMTELGPIPVDWEVKRINQCGDVVTGSTPPRGNSELWGGSFNWISAKDFKGKYIISSDEKVTEAGKRYCRALPTNSVLVTCIASIGLNAIAKRPCATNQQINAVVCRDCDYEYFYYQCCFNESRLRQMAGQTAVPIIGKSQFEGFNIVLPKEINEQRRIAGALSDIDELISALGKLIKKKRNIKTGAMQELLGMRNGECGMRNVPRRRLPGFSGAWVEKRLGDYAIVARGGSPRPIEAFLTSHNDGLNWVKIGDVGVGAKYIERTAEKILPSGLSSTRMVYPGDFLLSNSMSFGRPYIMKITGCIHDGWLVIQDYKTTFDTEYLYYVLGSEMVVNQYRVLAAGSSVLNLNKDVVASVTVVVPPTLAEQKAIAAVLSDMDAEIAALEADRAKYERIKSGMMQELLTGKTRLLQVR